MSSKTINLLTQLQTGELSLVRRGANNKRIALTKSEDVMSLETVLKDVLDTEAEGEGTLVESLKAAGAEDETIEIAKANYRLQHSFKDKLSGDTLAEVTKAAGYGMAPKPGDKEPLPAAVKKDTEMPPELAVLFKAQQDELSAVKKTLEVERADRVRKEYVEKCETKYTHVPGMNSDQMGEMLQKAYEVGEAFGKQLEDQWAATSEAVKKSTLLSTRGSGHVVPANGSDPMAKLNTIAKDLAAKEQISFAKAFDRAMVENNELYEEYLADNPAQTGRRS